MYVNALMQHSAEAAASSSASASSSSSPTAGAGGAEMEADEMEKQRRLFILGLMVLFGWMMVIVFCVYPQLFRDLLLRYVCCCWTDLAAVRRRDKHGQSLEQVKRAQERVRSASRSFLSVSMAANPSAILLKQVGLGGNLVELGLRKQQRLRGCGGESGILFFPEPIPELLESSGCPSRAEDEDEEQQSQGAAEALMNAECRHGGGVV